MSPSNRRLLPGTVDLVILRTLADGPKHGFGVSRAIQSRSDGFLELQDAALYQALHRMERAGWVDAEWGTSAKGKRAKFYRLTRDGTKQLERDARYWRRYAEAVEKILNPARG